MSTRLLKPIVGALVLVLIVQALLGPILSASNTVDGSIALGADGEREFVYAGNVTEVRNTTGRALRLSKEAELQVSGGIGVQGDTWTWSTTVAVDNTSRSQVLWGIRDEYLLAYDGSAGELVLWHYNESSTNSYALRVPASPSSLTTVQATRNGSTLRLYNGSGSSSSLTLTPSTDNSAPTPTYGSLDGRLEETRTWGRVLNSTERQQVRDRPILPLTGNRRARLMFDTQGRDVAVDLRSASGEVVGGYPLLEDPRASGFAGAVLQEGVSYELDTTNELTLRMTGDYERAPRVAVSTPNSLAGDIARLIGVFAMLIVLVSLVGALRGELG